MGEKGGEGRCEVFFYHLDARSAPKKQPTHSLTSVLAARSVNRPIRRSRLPSRSGESSGLRVHAGRPRRRPSRSNDSPFWDRAFLRQSLFPLVEGSSNADARVSGGEGRG